MRRTSVFLLAVLSTVPSSVSLAAQGREATPVRQSELTAATAVARPLTLRDVSHNDRWLGLGVRDVRWAPDGSGVFFRWSRTPASDDVADEDAWFLAGPAGDWVEEVPLEDRHAVPGADVQRSPDGIRAAWVGGGSLYLHDAARGSRRVVALDQPIREPHFSADGAAVDFEVGSALYRYDVQGGGLAPLAARIERTTPSQTDAAAWLRAQQQELFAHVRTQGQISDRTAEAARLSQLAPSQAIPVGAGVRVDQIQLSPDGSWLTFRARTPSSQRPATQYANYVDESGYTEVLDARSKVGEPRDVYRLGVVRVDPNVPLDSITVRWVDVDKDDEENTRPSRLSWNSQGTRAVAQFLGEDDEDLWVAEIDLVAASARILTHDHDDAWIGGPPVQANSGPTLMEWVSADELAFASERSGWSHLYLLGLDGAVTPLTEGPWEVRGASLSPDRSTWLLQTSREHPAEDHLYRMPARGGQVVRLTSEVGRHEGWWSPDGRRLAVVSSESIRLPDLFMMAANPGSAPTRVTVSGSDNYWEHPLTRAEIVTFAHPDGGPLWGALFRPDVPNAERSAIVHIHGGGYRQFAHRGYSVYGYDHHLGFIQYMLEQGYTVLDFDYRGSAGYGRDYRTDIAESMGIKDTDGAVAAARWLAHNADVDPDRIGIYGVSYGGFLTLTSLFRYPGVFRAGIARAAVTDWAHYSDGWTSRILGVPHENPEAYRISSPIYYAEGLSDPLLITHGLMDDNVHFQDAARLVQRLIELEKDFEVMVYPVEPHVVATEASRYDLVRRQAGFFNEKLRGIHR